MLLESVRAGNKGRLVSYASIFGLVLQNISWVVTLPLWLSLHLLTSPISKIVRNSEQSVAQRLVSTYHPWDTVLVPLSVVQAFVVPAILMSLPSGFLNYSVATHYGWNAVWQAFPLWNVLILALLRRTPLAKEGNSGGNEERGRRTTKIAVDETQEAPSVLFTYSFALILAAGVHLPILALSLLPTSLRLFLASHSPVGTGYLRSLLERGTFMNIFIPSSWPFGSEQPSVSSTAYASGDLAPLATQFLQYDLLVASVPFFLWALYLRQTAIRNANVFDALGKAAYWLVLGGPHAAVIILLRERDIALSGHGSSVKKVN